MLGGRALWLALLLVSCVSDPTVPCGAIRCPEDYACLSNGACAPPAAVEECRPRTEGDACTYVDGSPGVCEDTACSPTVCGDGRTDPSEDCDDSNLVAGDGCSVSCKSEVCGNREVDTAAGEECDSGIRGLSGDGCSSTCRAEIDHMIDVSPTLISPRIGTSIAADAANRMVLFGGYDRNGDLGDTWVFESNRWRPRTVAAAPASRFDYGLAYDAARGQTILFGGNSLGQYYADTWAWDGFTWTLLAPTNSPPAGTARMVYDSLRQRIVLWGWNGPIAGQTWIWNGVTWTQLQGAMQLPSSDGALAYDVLRDRVVLYALGTTYVFDGNVWSRPSWNRPNVHVAGAMAYDANRQVVVLFGGTRMETHFNETWELGASAWQLRDLSTSPSTRTAAAMAADPRNGTLVLFGGQREVPAGGVALLGDTSIYGSNGTWTVLPPVVAAPPARELAAMAYDKRRGKNVMFGGADPACLQDIWVLDANAGWASRIAPIRPDARHEHAMVYDEARGVTVLFGGICNSVFADTWELTDIADRVVVEWTQRSPSVTPPGRFGHALAYDAGRARTVMFGGTDKEVVFADTWEYDGTTWAARSPAFGPAARSGHVMAYDPVRGVTVMFGGSSSPDGTWEWDGTTWKNIPGPTPRHAEHLNMVYDPILARIVVLARTTIWTWDGVAWEQRVLQQAPPDRTRAVATYDALRRQFIRFGGSDAFGGQLVDTWGYERVRVGASVERCLLADEDYDGDGLAGCADPDCWGRCAPLCLPGQSCAGPHCGDGTCDPVEDASLCPGDCP